MKLITAIVNKDDSVAVQTGLTSNGFQVTRLATTGGFLQAGNVTFMIAVDDAKVDELDKLVRQMYDDITNNEKMAAYNKAQDEFNDMFEYVLHILQMAATGDDPDSIEKPEEGSGCSGDCGSCGGCG